MLDLHRALPLAAALALLAGCQPDQQPADSSAGLAAVPASYSLAPSSYQAPPAFQPQALVPFAHPRSPSGLPSDHIVLPVSLNGGPPRAFLLDTGAPLTCVLLSPQLLSLQAVSLKLQAAPHARIQGIAGASAAAYRTSASSLAVGSAQARDFPYLLLACDRDLSSLGQTPWGPVVGILGNDFLSRFRLTLDYTAGTVSLAQR